MAARLRSTATNTTIRAEQDASVLRTCGICWSQARRRSDASAGAEDYPPVPVIVALAPSSSTGPDGQPEPACCALDPGQRLDYQPAVTRVLCPARLPALRAGDSGQLPFCCPVLAARRVSRGDGRLPAPQSALTGKRPGVIRKRTGSAGPGRSGRLTAQGYAGAAAAGTSGDAGGGGGGGGGLVVVTIVADPSTVSPS